MSLQSLISGSECAVPANPLSQVIKHTESDRSLQHDRIGGPSTSRLQQLSSTSSLVQVNEQDLVLAHQFFNGNLNNQGMGMPLQADLPRLTENQTPGMYGQWSLRSQPQIALHDGPAAQAAWAVEFSNSPQNHSPDPTAQQEVISVLPPAQQRRYSPQMHGYSMPIGMYGMGVSNFQHPNYSTIASSKGKAKEIDFEAAFAQVAESIEQRSSVIELSDDATKEVGSVLTNISLKENESKETDTATEGLWKDLLKSESPSSAEELARWESELSQLMNSERDRLEDIGNNVQQIYEANNYHPSAEKVLRYDDEGIPLLGPYVFEKNNRFLDSPISSKDLLIQAKDLLERSGSFSEAALMLEAVIQHGELGEGGYEAWVLLGETRNMDEREDLGMRALMEGVRRAEDVGSAAGMLSLAISFTNESFDKGSHTMLLRWFRTRYPDIAVPQEMTQTIKTSMAWVIHEKITELFLDLTRKHHAAGRMDDEMQIALGVLFYNVGEYSRAHDCFAAALSARPRDYRLWNRLGSCLSNDRKPEEALGAYREALQLRPTYTRAIFNVGVACLNIGANKEAAEHFLSALSLQESSGTTSETSDSLWSTLRKALYGMDRTDLAELAKPETRANLEIFRKEGFDF